jgi:hypothetical protein
VVVSARRLTGLLAMLAGLLLLAPPVSYAFWAYGLTTMCLTNLDLQRLTALAAAGVALAGLGLWALLGARRMSQP